MVLSTESSHGFTDITSPHEQAPEDNKHNAVIGQKGWENRGMDMLLGPSHKQLNTTLLDIAAIMTFSGSTIHN
jgi:hypothetical protein